MGVFFRRWAIAHADLDRADQHSVLVRVNWDPNPFTFVTKLCFHPHMTLYIDHRSGSLEMWTDPDQTGSQLRVTSVRFCGGQHLDHITAYSADGLPVLELCRRSDAQKVMVRTLTTRESMSGMLCNGCKRESMWNPNHNSIYPELSLAPSLTLTQTLSGRISTSVA